MFLTHLRRSAAVIALPAFVAVLALHVALRSRPWVHEWLWTFDQHHFVFVLLGPVAAGVAAWDAASWSSTKAMCAVADRPASPLVRSWAATTAIVWSAFLVALLATGAFAARAGAPGWPPVAALTTTVPALAVLALCTALGASAGWLIERTLVAPVVSIVVFGLLIASYTHLPGLFVEVGGATSSLIGLAPRPGLQAAQVVWCAAAAGTVLVLARRRWVPAAYPVVVVGTLVASTAWVLSFGGDRFREVPVDVRCVGGEPSVCLAVGYEYLRAPLHDRFDRAGAALAATGVAHIRRVTQDIGDGDPDVIRVFGEVHGDEDVVSAIMPLLVPSECETGDRADAYSSWMGIHDWLTSIVTGSPADEMAPADVRRGGAVAARWVVDAVERLRSCAS